MPPPSSRRLVAALACVAAVLCNACSAPVTVRPWEKGLLAKPEMRFEYEPMDAMFAEHVYSSKEAAAGGNGVSGGGCGCN